MPREPNRYRHTDKSHVRACVGISGTHPGLRDKAIGQLLDLLAAPESGVAQRVEEYAADLFIRHQDLVGDQLRSMSSAGNARATTLLALIDGLSNDERVQAGRAASRALTAPLTNTATSIGFGTDAVRQSHHARHLPPEERKELTRVQLERAASPFEPGENRIEFYAAAANLAHDIDNTDELFERAMAQADNASPSTADLLINSGNHPLSTFGVSGARSDTRAHALQLAASLARSPSQRTQVRDHAIRLLGKDGAAPYVSRALQIVAEGDLGRDVPLLATQKDPAARALAAYTWARSSSVDPALGLVLACDADARVRRPSLMDCATSTRPWRPNRSRASCGQTSGLASAAWSSHLIRDQAS